MNNPYYTIWADSINRYKRFHPENRNWKSTLVIFISWMNALNLWIIFIWLKYFGISLPLLSINIFPGTLVDAFFSFTAEFALPFGILNYFFVFYKDRYKAFINNYPNQNASAALIYSMTIALSAFLSAILYSVLK
jgi:hypothetical protein